MGVSDGWVEVGDQVFVRRYEFFDQNIGLILGRAEALVIDTRSTYAQAREIQEDVREVTDSPIGVVVDTHGHFDHAFGNAVFRPATIWGHERCVSFIIRTGERRKVTIAAEEPQIADELREIVIDPPDRVFATHATVAVGGREVNLRFLGRGHTDHDILIDVPGTDVVFGGDLVENGNVPFFNDGYPLEWPATLEALAGRAGGDVVLVPGHGDHGGKTFLDAQIESLTRLADLARRVDAGEMPLDEAVAQHPYPEHPPEDARRGFERALAQVRGELDRVETGQ
jgi:glyoxylase-like metal-dependent hydrolase (beta-lactamase superfamily II)